MAKTTTVRDVAADLIGNGKPTTKGKVTKGNGSTARRATKPARGPAAKYEPTQRIVIVKPDREVRAGSAIGNVWQMVLKSKTIGDFLKRRKAAKMEGMGGFFGQFVKEGSIRVGK